VNRKVEVETAPLQVVAPPPLEKIKDPTLPKGVREVEEYGVPAADGVTLILMGRVEHAGAG